MSSTVKGPSEMKLSISISPSRSVGELKDEIASKSDVEKERQRLIYSGEWDLSCIRWAMERHRTDNVGKVLKDQDPISTYKIQVSYLSFVLAGYS
jgi:ubiquilin